MMNQLSLAIGDRVIAEVEELIANYELIVSYQGQLLRVKNSSGVEFKKGDKLDLIVYRIDPIELRLHSKEINYGPRSLDRFG